MHQWIRRTLRFQTAPTLRAAKAPGAWLLGGLAASALLAGGPAHAMSVDFDPSPDTELNDTFQDGDTPGDGFEQLSGVSGGGTGDPASGGVEFSGTIPSGDFDLNENAVYTGGTFSLAAGDRVRFGGDVRFDALDGTNDTAAFQLADVDTTPTPSGVSLFATKGDGLDLSAQHFTPGENDGQPLGSMAEPTGTLDWLRLEGEVAYDGTDLELSATLSSIGPDGESAPTPLLSLAPTSFSNAGLEGSEDLFFLFGGLAVDGDGGPAPAGSIYFDNVNVVPEPTSGLLIGGGLLGLGLARRRTGTRAS